MSVLVLGQADVERLLPMAACLDVMAEVLGALARDEVHNPLRFVVRPPQASGLMGLMPAYRGGTAPAYALKAVCVFPGNPARGLDAHQGAVLLHDADTGELRAVLNASAVTAIRTAAVSGVATRLLSRPESRILAVLGAGVQARSHLDAMTLVRPFEEVRIWSRRLERATGLAAETSRRLPGARATAAPTARDAVQGADVIVTATSSPTPVVERDWIAEGAHVNAVGSSIPTARELDTRTMADASLFVDRRESTLNESGDYLFAAREGAIGPDHIQAEIGELIAGRHPGRRDPREITVFKSLGLAAEDLAAAAFVYRRAVETGAGTTVAFQ